MSTSRQSEVGAIRQLVLKHAKDAYVSGDLIARQWRKLNYPSPPEFTSAVDEYDKFVALLEQFNIDTHFLPKDESLSLDSIYVRDASIVCDKGVILCNMGKDERRGEPEAVERAFRSMGVPIHGAITGDGWVEGGDVLWIDEVTLAVGRGYRTNDEGIRQLKDLLKGCAEEVITVHLPHWRGPGDVFHLMSIISPIDYDLALVYSPLMPVNFRQDLLSRSYTLVEVPDAEFDSMGCNVLAVAPRKCVILACNPETKARLEAAGAEVYVYKGNEISVKGAGGPTCLTHPILRDSWT